MGKIVSTAARHNKHGNPQLDQLRQIAMHSPISTEDKNRVRLIGVCRQIDKPAHFRVLLERLQVFGGTSRPEDCSSAHVRGRLSEIGVGTLPEKAIE